MNTSNKNATQDLWNRANTKNNSPRKIRVYAHLRTYIKQARVQADQGRGLGMGIRMKGSKKQNKHNTKPERALGDRNNPARN